MQEPRVQLYMAVSLDGYIATEDGGIDWLTPFQADYGFELFQANVDASIMGRVTYDQVKEHMGASGQHGRLIIVSRKMEPAPNAEVWSGGLTEKLQTLRGEISKNIWLVGGGQIVRAFLEEDLVDEIWLYAMPVFLGRGISGFPESHATSNWRLERTRGFPNGVLEAIYLRAAVTS